MDTWNWIFGIFHFHSTPGDIHPLPLPLICLCTGSVNLTRTSSYTFLGFLDYSNAYLSHNIHTFKQHRLELCDLNDGLWPLSTNRPSISISPHLLNRALYTPAFFLVSFPPLRLCRLISPNSRSLVHLFFVSLHPQPSCIPTYHFFLLQICNIEPFLLPINHLSS